MASGEAPPSSSRETASIDNSTKTKSKCSMRSLLVANCCFFKPETPENETPENITPNDVSSSATIEGNDHQGEGLPPSCSKMIPNDLLDVDKALEEFTAHMKSQINTAREKFEALQNLRSSERDSEKTFELLRKGIAMLKLQIPTRVDILPYANEDDDHGGAALSDSLKLMRNDLLLVDSTFAKTTEYMDHVWGKINEAHHKFKELHLVSNASPEEGRDFHDLRKTIEKLKVQIPSHAKIRSGDSYRHPYQWPTINGPDDKKTHFFYKDPEDTYNGNSDGLWEDFSSLPLQILRICLFCFFKFPPEAIIKRTAMIYMWIGLGYTNFFLNRQDTNEYYANWIFDYLVDIGFIQPIYQTCSLVPDSCSMSRRVRAALYDEAKYLGFTSSDNHRLELGFVGGQSCLVNVGQANLNWKLEVSSNEEPPHKVSPNKVSLHDFLVENARHIRNLYLGRWQGSTTRKGPTHHIELTDVKVLDGLKNMKILTFLSLQGISMITELPTSMVNLKCLEILDLRACHNLEAIPENIGTLKSLTHLDMSECYFLEHMPKSLSKLSNLEVLKGFVVGEENKESCTLFNLSSLNKLRKLNIYVSVKNFAGRSDFDHLQDFKVLQKLTISWGGSSFEGENSIQEKSGEERLPALCTKGCLELPQTLQKLDLRCFPAECLANWFKPAKIAGLKKLYIQGGRLCRIGQIQECQVEILRLKYLHDLEIDWSELRKLFPKLIYLMYKAEDTELAKLPSNKKGMRMNLEAGCPEFTMFSRNEGTVWMSKEGLRSDKQLQKLQKYLKQVALA